MFWVRSFLLLLVASCLLSACRGGGEESPVSAATSTRPAGTTVPENPDTFALLLDPHPAGVAFMAWSPDGEVLATSDGLSTRLWDTGGALIASLATDRAAVTALSWAADSRTLATGDSSGVVSLWGRDGTLVSTIVVSDDDPAVPVSVVNWSPVGTLLATGTVLPPDPATPGPFTTLSAAVRLWQPDGTEVRRFEIAHSFRGEVRIFWSEDGSRLAAGGNDIHVWEASGDEVFAIPGGEYDVRPSFAFAPDGSRLAFVDMTGTLQIHPVDGSTPLSAPGFGGERAIRFSPDSASVAVATDHQLQVVDAVNPLATRVQALTNGVQSAPDWSPDGRLLAAGVARRAVQIATVEGDPVALLTDCEGTVATVTWSPDGSRLAAGFADGRVCVWEVPRR